MKLLRSLLPENLTKLRAMDVSGLPEVLGNPRIGPCVGSVGKIVCVGLNYSVHAAESGLPVPDEPVLFMKAIGAICCPYDNVEFHGVPRGRIGKSNSASSLAVWQNMSPQPGQTRLLGIAGLGEQRQTTLAA
jgi:hypothetical protein